jgi:hypothetical protein
VAKNVVCPFCGLGGIRTDEHVWAQWMHTTPGAVELLQDARGERIEREHSGLRRGDDGRYRYEVVKAGRMAMWLPNVKVPVGNVCNNGWMAQLEESTKKILGPFVFDGTKPLRLSPDHLHTLATWATKSWMAYALLRVPHQNPFTTDEYRSMASFPQPLDRTQIWMLHSLEPQAHVGLGIESTLLSTGETPPDLASAQDNWAYGYLAVSTVVFAMQLLPPGAPPETGDVLAPPMLASSIVRRIWPEPRAQYFPLDVVQDANLRALLDYPQQIFNATGLPTVGLTDDDATGVLREFQDGADPAELRRRWNQPG